MKLPKRRIFLAAVITYLVGCILLQVWVHTRFGRETTKQPRLYSKRLSRDGRRLGVVVPIHSREVSRAFKSLRRWPAKCPEGMSKKMDLVLYFTKAAPNQGELLSQLGDSCFGTTKTITAQLTPEDNRHLLVRSIQFYALFLDPDVRAHVVEYDALAIVDWDVIVAHETTFARLYSHTFSSGEGFWIKGSRLAGSGFHDIAALPEMWHILGHLDGNAIYNNTDPTFIEYVNFTRSRWGLSYSYDVALWATISDYPYSWPLWQRYASKFVVTNMVSMIYPDERDEAVSEALKLGNLFFHEREEESEDEASTRIKGCKAACEKASGDENSRISVCDSTCLGGGDTFTGARFNGHNCGAGNVAKFGKACRLCYEDQEAAIAADDALATEAADSSTPDAHVIMCSTKRPPEATNCPRECSNDINTVCDHRCGSGKYGDWQCDWRGIGKACRFCFRDVTAARLADVVARRGGGRVIMCDTHEPPPAESEDGDANKPVERNLDEEDAPDPNGLGLDVGDMSSDWDSASPDDMETVVDSSSPVDPASPMELPAVKFPDSITNENICVFISGYFEFYHETKVSIQSVQKFMPGVRVTIATHPMDFHVFNRTLAEEHVVSVVNCTHPGYAALTADTSCGEDTSLIYYLNPGELVTRTFTAKDTHSPRGDLLVKYADVEIVGPENARRAMASTIILGFHSPSFTYGSDLILPAKMNLDLREMLMRAAERFGADEEAINADLQGVDRELFQMYRFLDALAIDHLYEISIYIPELLAAIIFSESPAGVQFINPRHWKHQPPFPETSVWDVPLMKPRIGCTSDISPSLKGYDVASHLAKRLDAFAGGARCDRGFMAIDPAIFQLKPEWEFPLDRSGWTRPSLRDYRVSVMYRTFSGDADLFKISLPMTIKNIQEALEIVVVVEEEDVELFEEIVAPHRESAPFPLRIIPEPTIMDGHIQQKYSKIRADIYTEGDYVLHLDSDVVVFEEINYEHMFHLGKPVLPFRRYRDETPEGLGISSCWRNGTSQAIGKDVVHEFSLFNTHVYPRRMYPALREFLEERHEKPLADFMSERRGKCWSPKTLSQWTLEERTSLLSDFNLMGAFLWYHMHDAVYWLAADPLDLQPDQWRPNLTKYAWVCQANARTFPEDEEEKSKYKVDLLSVRSSDECNSVVQYWRRRKRIRRQETAERVTAAVEKKT